MQPLTGRPCRQLVPHLPLRQQKKHGRQPRSAAPVQCRMCSRKQGKLRQQLHCQAKQNPDRSGLYEGLGWALGGQQGKLLLLPAPVKTATGGRDVRCTHAGNWHHNSSTKLVSIHVQAMKQQAGQSRRAPASSSWRMRQTRMSPTQKMQSMQRGGT